MRFGRAGFETGVAERAQCLIKLLSVLGHVMHRVHHNFGQRTDGIAGLYKSLQSLPAPLSGSAFIESLRSYKGASF